MAWKTAPWPRRPCRCRSERHADGLALANSSVTQAAGLNAGCGTLTSIDRDDTRFTYTLVAGSGDTHNGAFNLADGTLRANNATALPGGSYSGADSD